ncbi:UNVERIFIED_CONTAM: hypothetical protein K2H54_056110 [Gekko kuhli]
MKVFSLIEQVVTRYWKVIAKAPLGGWHLHLPRAQEHLGPALLLAYSCLSAQSCLFIWSACLGIPGSNTKTYLSYPD